MHSDFQREPTTLLRQSLTSSQYNNLVLAIRDVEIVAPRGVYSGSTDRSSSSYDLISLFMELNSIIKLLKKDTKKLLSSGKSSSSSSSKITIEYNSNSSSDNNSDSNCSISSRCITSVYSGSADSICGVSADCRCSVSADSRYGVSANSRCGKRGVYSSVSADSFD
ncbi:hypothetical protein ACTFIY_008736 [Dictyostelium cf. discoideum]